MYNFRKEYLAEDNLLQDIRMHRRLPNPPPHCIGGGSEVLHLQPQNRLQYIHFHNLKQLLLFPVLYFSKL